LLSAKSTPPCESRGKDAQFIERWRIYSTEKIAVNASIVFFLPRSIMEAQSHA
jgi:hypothetical protein